MRLLAVIVGVLGLAGCAGVAPAVPDQTVWRFDRLDGIGGRSTQVEGRPVLIETPAGAAVHFDGCADALFIAAHPLADAKTFTFEAIFRPEGGAFEQRWFHLAEIDPATGKESSARILFEIRVTNDRWYLDTFVTGPGYKTTLVVPEKTFAIGRWYRVAQTFDGKTYRSYVDGVLQAQAETAYRPQGAGHASVGVRINRVNYFHGAVFAARFTLRALAPADFAPLPAGLNAQ
jgi:hypothetical protein